MRHFYSSFILVLALLALSCNNGSDDDPNASPEKSYIKTLYKNYSPDKTKLLTLKEHITVGESGYTQIMIEFGGSGAGVYTVDTIGVNIKTYWIDNHQIVIETKKSYKGMQKWKQVQSFNDIVKVKYIEQ